MKVLTVLGARPQFIKAAMLSKAFAEAGLKEVLLHTGQHFDPNMSGAFFEEFQLAAPQYHLGIHSLPREAMIDAMQEAIVPILEQEQPDIVLVYGDTNSTLAGALAAQQVGIPIAHVEAGLRSGNANQPEEKNRIATDALSEWLFVPNAQARLNLIAEGIAPEKIHQVGDIMYDLFLAQQEKLPNINELDLPEHFALLTLHRQENVDDPQKLQAWVEALQALSKEITLLCPLHPRTAKALTKLNLSLPAKILAPLSQGELLAVLAKSQIVLTDSGGLQKEAFYARKPCLTLREETEWKELISMGLNVLSSPDRLLSDFRRLKDLVFEGVDSVYGDGDTAFKIVSVIN